MSALSLDLSFVLIMVLVYSLYFILKKYLFNPINQILANRDAAINGGQQEAQNNLVRCHELTGDHEKALKTARQESYRQQEKFRSEALKVRAETVAEGKVKAEKQVTEARQETGGQVASAKKILESEVSSIADGIVKTVLR
jgi:F-type H+-transporting ATPase subunit b